MRTDQELHAMLNCYVTMTANGEEFHVFPKTVDHMNTFKLKVAIGPTLSSEILNQPNYTEGPLTYEVSHDLRFNRYFDPFTCLYLMLKFDKSFRFVLKYNTEILFNFKSELKLDTNLTISI